MATINEAIEFLQVNGWRINYKYGSSEIETVSNALVENRCLPKEISLTLIIDSLYQYSWAKYCIEKKIDNNIKVY